MKTIVSMAGIAAVALSTAVLADPTNRPMERASQQLLENIAENPDNQGMPNAVLRLQENELRQSTRGRNHAPGQQRVERVERVERPERPERIERVDLPTRAEIARAQRPERPERGLAKGHK
jgi:hypothetical protein